MLCIVQIQHAICNAKAQGKCLCIQYDACACIDVCATASRYTLKPVLYANLINYGENMSYTLPDLGYAYDALEPHFDEQTMQIHHQKHHQAYVDNANKALEDLPQWADKSAEEVIANLQQLPKDKQTALRNNAGGHANHSLFWSILKTGTTLQGSLKEAIVRDFGSVEAFYEAFEAAAKSRFGSGWAWLVKQGDKLAVVSTANQDSPLMGDDVAGCHGTPIIGLDVWEHAYYLKYQNKRPDYIKAFWQVVNWDKAQENFDNA